MPDGTGIWLEVSNVRKEGEEVTVQLKGDKADREAVWWEVDGKDPDTINREISRGLDKKRIVLAKLAQHPKEPKLHVKTYRIQFADSTTY